MHPEEELAIVGDGSNVLPMVHVKDLAQLIKKMIDLGTASVVV
jgi:nucleoside-diphosphate-sugar epimerase